MTLLHEWFDRATVDCGNAKALVYRDNYLSWRGLRHRVDRRAQEFSSMGIRAGDWVGVMLGNVPDFIILTLALSKVGAAVVPIDPTTASREFDLILETVPLRALITRPRGSESTLTTDTRPLPRAPLPPEPKRDGAESRRRLQGTLLTCSVYKRPKIDADPKPDVIILTSDSAGDPRAVLRTRKNLVAEVDILTELLALDQETKILTAAPLFDAYGWDFGFMAALRHGATIHIEEELSARRIAKLLRENEIDVLPGTPSLYSELARMPAAKQLKRKGLRFLAAGARLTETVADSFRETWGVRLMSVYHTTEAGTIAIDTGAKAAHTVGKVAPNVEVRLTLPDGGKPAIGELGTIWVRSPAVAPLTLGPYTLPPQKNGRIPIGGRDPSGWLRTGDTGRFDRSARLCLSGREDDLVKVDGKRVALGEVEGCLESFPKVKQAQARLVTDPLSGPMVVARVVTATKCHAEEIIDHCAKNLAPYKVPRRIEFCERLS